jgi:hypothetical protein
MECSGVAVRCVMIEGCVQIGCVVDVSEGERVTVGVWLIDIVLVGLLDGVAEGFGDGDIATVLLNSLDGLPHPDKHIITMIVNPRVNIVHCLSTEFSLT